MATTVPNLPTNTPPALERILPYVVSGASAAISALSAAFQIGAFLVSKTANSFLYFSPLPIILYFLAPALVFFDILADVFLRVPYQLSLYILDAFYPIYVFCGVACITGAVIGIMGRLASKLLVDMVQGRYFAPPEVKMIESEKKRGKRAKI